MVWRARWAELRTALTGVDPGRVRLRLGGIAVVSMVLAVGVMAGVRAITGEPVTVVLMAAVLSMVSNLAVNEPGLARLRAATALMAPPAPVAVTAGTLLAPHRIVADVVFVAVMIAAVWVRRYGPRGNALAMAAMMGYFFTQFLNAATSQIPTLLLAVVVGIGATLVLRGWVFREDPERTLERLTSAFRAHLHALVEALRAARPVQRRDAPGARRGDRARPRTRSKQPRHTPPGPPTTAAGPSSSSRSGCCAGSTRPWSGSPPTSGPCARMLSSVPPSRTPRVADLRGYGRTSLSRSVTTT